MKNYGLFFIIALLLQYFFSNLLTIRSIRPDFIIIFLLYYSVNFGSFKGVIAGFCVGLIVGLLDNSTTLGLLCLIYSTVGYFGGLLQKQTYKMLPFQFNLYSFLIIIGCFFIYTFYTYEYQFYNNFTLFILTWIKTTVYTVVILILLQFIMPLQKIQNVKNNK